MKIYEQNEAAMPKHSRCIEGGVYFYKANASLIFYFYICFSVNIFLY